ncbi:MAG: thioredoxin domain-containing protein [Propionibacteriaceae bacterium]|nr:thioredoxin domain-containing protein [Propionibacteriaceae bacterium]
MSTITDVTEATFSTEVLGSSRPVFIDYWADWCAPCKQLSPIIDELATQYQSIKFCKVDTNANPGLAARQGVMSLPTLQVIVGGELVTSIQGGKTKAGIIAMLQPYV